MPGIMPGAGGRRPVVGAVWHCASV
jgi:hypothetical protein